MFSMSELSKSKHKFRGMKVCKPDEVREYFINPKTENEALGQCVNLVWISEVPSNFVITFVIGNFEVPIFNVTLFICPSR